MTHPRETRGSSIHVLSLQRAIHRRTNLRFRPNPTNATSTTMTSRTRRVANRHLCRCVIRSRTGRLLDPISPDATLAGLAALDPVLVCGVTAPLMWGRASALQIGALQQA